MSWQVVVAGGQGGDGQGEGGRRVVEADHHHFAHVVPARNLAADVLQGRCEEVTCRPQVRRLVGLTALEGQVQLHRRLQAAEG